MAVKVVGPAVASLIAPPGSPRRSLRRGGGRLPTILHSGAAVGYPRADDLGLRPARLRNRRPDLREPRRGGSAPTRLPADAGPHAVDPARGAVGGLRPRRRRGDPAPGVGALRRARRRAGPDRLRLRVLPLLEPAAAT